MIRIRLAAPVVMAFFTGACGTAPEPAPPVEAPPPEPTMPTLALDAPPVPASKPEPRHLAARGTSESPRKMKPAPAPRHRPPFPRLDPAELIGLDAREVLARLGKPTQAHRNDAWTLWTYDHRACRLTLHFRFTVADNALRALEHTLEPGGEGATPLPICLHLLAKQDVAVASAGRASPD